LTRGSDQGTAPQAPPCPPGVHQWPPGEPEHLARIDDTNQLGRRNLKPDQMSYIRGRLYNRKKKAGARNDLLPGCQKVDTAKVVGEAHGVSSRTVIRDLGHRRLPSYPPPGARSFISDRYPRQQAGRGRQSRQGKQAPEKNLASCPRTRRAPGRYADTPGRLIASGRPGRRQGRATGERLVRRNVEKLDGSYGSKAQTKTETKTEPRRKPPHTSRTDSSHFQSRTVSAQRTNPHACYCSALLNKTHKRLDSIGYYCIL